MRTDVAIIGGALAGLVATRLPQQERTELILLEARDRLGGRACRRRSHEQSE
jgi:monoamine oxidase